MSSEVVRAREVHVEKHFKMKCDAGRLTIATSNSVMGVWLMGDDNEKSIGMICQKGLAPYFMVPGPKGYRNSTPFALSANGLQVPLKDGGVKLIPLEKLAEMLAALAD